MTLRFTLALAGPIAGLLALAHGDRSAPVDFARDVRPILLEKCFACHGPDAKHRQADLYLDERDQIFRELDADLDVVRPFDLEHSELYLRISAEDDSERMPPPESGKSLTDAEIETLRQWIEQGAEWKEHWAFAPAVKRPLPEVSDPSWCRNAIDHFVLARLDQQGSKPSPEASKEALIRRASFDLTGLPPALEEIDAFTADRSPEAYERVLDRLLASLAYGERMASLWLDLAAYGDTNGYHIDNHRDMWKWREGVIEAFNRNQPFDRFTIEQLAGDMLPDATLAQRVASGFNRNHPINFEGGADPDEYQTKYVIDRVKNTATTWMGLTIGCAECHDHKYDPLSQREFYEFYALFDNIPEKGLDGDVLNAVPSIKVPTPEQEVQLTDLDALAAGLTARFEAPDAALDAEQSLWESATLAALPPPVRWRGVEPVSVASKNGAVLNALPDGSFLASGANPARDVYELVALPGKSSIGAIRLEALVDESLPHGGAGRADDANFVLTDFDVETATLAHPEMIEKLEFVAARADFEQEKTSADDFSILSAIDDKSPTGWGVAGFERRENRTAVFILAHPVSCAEDGILRVYLRFESTLPRSAIGRFRISVAEDASAYAFLLPHATGPWKGCGPFGAASAEAAIATAFGPEQEHLAGREHAESYPEGRAVWREVSRWRDGAPQTVTGDPNTVWYFTRDITCASARKLRLHVGSDDALKIWISGVPVYAHSEPRSPDAVPDPVEVELKQGVNRLLCKVINLTGEERFYFKAEALPHEGMTPELAEIVRTDVPLRTAAQGAGLRDYFRGKVSPNGVVLATELAQARANRRAHFDAIPESMVMQEMGERRKTHVLVRGDFRAHGDEVQPGVPRRLAGASGAPVRDRLELARWLVSGEHPLVGRVTVNRLWQTLFGTGFVKASEDFGVRSEWPSHPELLDWLAVDFVEKGWDVKALLKEIASSATYRQSARASPELYELDPANRLLARGPRERLTAEMIRDNALAVSGLLVGQVGGPSVRPYQPPGLWEAVSFAGRFSSQAYEQDHGDKLWRRGLYVYWKRALPYPSLTTFDAPLRETCTSQRAETNTPLQALVLLNDPVFVEAARALAARTLLEGGLSDEERLVFAFRLCTSRKPSRSELTTLWRVMAAERASFKADADAAKKLIAVGESPVPAELDPIELATWTALSSVLLNLDETLHRGS